MKAYMLYKKMEGQKPYNLDTERKNLVDYVRFQGDKVIEHLDHVVDYSRASWFFS